MALRKEVFYDQAHWQSRAEQARILAATMDEEWARNMMLGVARDYERMGEMALRRLKRAQSLAETRQNGGA
jgi:hypothetical protein